MNEPNSTQYNSYELLHVPLPPTNAEWQGQYFYTTSSTASFTTTTTHPSISLSNHPVLRFQYTTRLSWSKLYFDKSTTTSIVSQRAYCTENQLEDLLWFIQYIQSTTNGQRCFLHHSHQIRIETIPPVVILSSNTHQHTTTSTVDKVSAPKDSLSHSINI